ncbi:hypothetical protein V5S92_10735, partial [Corynebacterium accolens]
LTDGDRPTISGAHHQQALHHTKGRNPTLPVAELRKRVDDLSKQYRELDTRIQQLNWNTELITS